MKPFLILFSLILFCSCTEKSVKKTTTKSGRKQNTTVQYLKRSLTDSLIRYTNLTEAQKHDDSDKYVLELTEINNTKVGYIAITDSVLFFFQLINNKWQLTDSIPFDTYAESYNVPDLNNDGRNDFIINGMGDIHGQSIPYVFMCDAQGTFHYRPDLGLYNIEYDQRKGLVRSSYEGGIYDTHFKEYYRWQADSLKLVRGVKEEPSENQRNNITSFYIMRDEKEYTYKSFTDNMAAIYDTALWRD